MTEPTPPTATGRDVTITSRDVDIANLALDLHAAVDSLTGSAAYRGRMWQNVEALAALVVEARDERDALRAQLTTINPAVPDHYLDGPEGDES